MLNCARFRGCRLAAILAIVEAMRIKQLTVHNVLADLSLAALSSVITVLGTVAFAAMIFSGPLARVVPLAFVTFLAGTTVSALVVGLLSRFYCNLSGARISQRPFWRPSRAASPA